jgi:protein-glutamine gamma-glutamyltransferase
MGTETHTSGLRKLASGVALMACLALMPQLPLLLSGLITAIVLAAWLLPKPHRLLILFLMLSSLAVLLLAFNGRFGRDTAAGMLALMIALKSMETAGLRDLRALLGFSLFLPFAAMLGNQEPFTLILALANILFWWFALYVSSTGDLHLPHGRWRAVAGLLAKQVLCALPMAAALFWLFPRISTPLWGLPGLSNQGSGLGDSMKPGQWLDSLTDDRIAFRVQFENKVPAPAERYWRGPVLWDFDGLQWRRINKDNQAVASTVAQVNDKTAIAYTVSLEATEKNYLPVLDWPRSAPAPYYLSTENSLYSDKRIQKMTQYRMRSVLSPDATAVLDEASRQRALAYPQGFNKRTQTLARQWRAEAGSDRAYIARIMAWIERDFAYTLDTELPRINAVDDFLFTDKKGFCQHFSSSFAVLMRAAGIPSRVVTGYVGGFRNPYGGYWVLYNKDAHAWNEVWLDGEGWVRFDATAAVAPENILDTINTRVSPEEEQYFGQRSAFAPLFDYGDFITSRWNDWVVGFNAARQTALFRKIGIEQAQRWQMLAVLLSIAGIISYAVFVVARRVPVLQQPLEQAWHKLLMRYSRAGLGKAEHETAVAFAERLARPELSAIASAYTQWRYGNRLLSQTQQSALALKMRKHRVEPRNQA